MSDSYFLKYRKYKTKYLATKSQLQIGGAKFSPVVSLREYLATDIQNQKENNKVSTIIDNIRQDSRFPLIFIRPNCFDYLQSQNQNQCKYFIDLYNVNDTDRYDMELQIIQNTADTVEKFKTDITTAYNTNKNYDKVNTTSSYFFYLPINPSNQVHVGGCYKDLSNSEPTDLIEKIFMCIWTNIFVKDDKGILSRNINDGVARVKLCTSIEVQIGAFGYYILYTFNEDTKSYIFNINIITSQTESKPSIQNLNVPLNQIKNTNIIKIIKERDVTYLKKMNTIWGEWMKTHIINKIKENKKYKINENEKTNIKYDNINFDPSFSGEHFVLTINISMLNVFSKIGLCLVGKAKEDIEKNTITYKIIYMPKCENTTPVSTNTVEYTISMQDHYTIGSREIVNKIMNKIQSLL